MDEYVVGCERELVCVVVLEFVVLAEFTGDFLKSKVKKRSKNGNLTRMPRQQCAAVTTQCSERIEPAHWPTQPL
jgi:hypothetical protein